MFDVVVEEEISAAHQLRAYQGKCEKLHGHNWRVRVEVTAEDTDAAGLALDFTVLKEMLRGVCEAYDHRYLNDLPEFQTINPTSENLARILYGQCAAALAQYPVRMKTVQVWESPRAFVRYYE